MKYNLICTSYTETPNGLVLRNNWIEVAEDDFQLMEILNNFSIDTTFPYPSKNSVSEILTGKMGLDNVIIHARLLRFL